SASNSPSTPPVGASIASDKASIPRRTAQKRPTNSSDDPKKKETDVATKYCGGERFIHGAAQPWDRAHSLARQAGRRQRRPPLQGASAPLRIRRGRAARRRRA